MPFTDTTGVYLGKQEERLAASNTPTEHDTSLDQDAFLSILVAQLTHQDPLNPMEDTDMTSQLAQFSSLDDRGWDNLRGGRGIFRDTPGMYKMRPEGLGRRFGNFFKIWAALRS
jgi:flagellar hook assembly protein FlgD